MNRYVDIFYLDYKNLNIHLKKNEIGTMKMWSTYLKVTDHTSIEE